MVYYMTVNKTTDAARQTKKGRKTMYNYRNAVKEDAKNYITENYTTEEIAERIADDLDRFAEELQDEMWTADEVTGNASGSYTFNTYRAEENLLHNFALIKETAEAFGIEPTVSAGYDHGPEWWDVTIRCYLLSEAVAEALEELKDELCPGFEEVEEAEEVA